MTLFRLLTEGTRTLENSGNKDAAIDARQLLLAAFHVDMTHFLLNRMQELPEDDFNRSAAELYHEMIRKRCRRMPLQQILGMTEFMGLPFHVNRHVLIPRQDTETLVEMVLEDCAKDGWRQQSLLDVCTGSGCIAVSLAVKGRFTQVSACDISEEALKVARRNAEELLKQREADASDAASESGTLPGVQFYQGDLFDALPRDGRKYDIITSNPPYIPTGVIATLEPEVKDHEPMLALDGSQDGLFFYRKIAEESGEYLTEGGRIYLEIGHDQGESVSALMREAGFKEVQVFQDLAGNDRVVRAVKL
jgi:release factor glutamine methyltransferase